MSLLAEWTALGELSGSWTADPEFFRHVYGSFMSQPLDAAVEAFLTKGAVELRTFAWLSLEVAFCLCGGW
jgi:hypothetical protein